ncbi:MAG: hypothetical protein L0227_17800 [Chloroflexi bacterium]|nr:hypothetical protein [Chloroflexota bacterium]
MSIVELQRRITEAGRIRTGLQERVERQDGTTGTRPAKLETFRFTSADRRRIAQIAELYGGKVAPWDAPAGKQWQVVSERSEIDVIVPPADLGFSQHYELWSAGGCQRRCDGVTESITEGPCKCNPEDRECDIHTRLSVMLRDVPGLGVWRLDTQGWYAAHELIGAVEVIAVAAGRGALLPARLRLDQRSVKRPDKNGKVVTRRFAVPVIDIEVTPAQLLAGGQGQPLQIAADRPAVLTAVPMLAAPVPSIAEQSAPPPERPKRANGATDIPASGRRRAQRTTAEADLFPEEAQADDTTPATKEAPGEAADAPHAAGAAPVGTEPAAPAPYVDLATAIRELAAASDLEGEPSDEQREALAQLFRGVPAVATLAGIGVLFEGAIGEDRRAHLTAAQAAGILTVAQSLDRDALRAAWTALAEPVTA